MIKVVREELEQISSTFKTPLAVSTIPHIPCKSPHEVDDEEEEIWEEMRFNSSELSIFGVTMEERMLEEDKSSFTIFISSKNQGVCGEFT